MNVIYTCSRTGGKTLLGASFLNNNCINSLMFEYFFVILSKIIEFYNYLIVISLYSSNYDNLSKL